MDNKAVFERLFNKDFSDSGNKQLLEEVTNAHPYFAVAQFFLLQQTSPGTEEFTSQAAKTGVLFNNPHWLNFQLQQTSKQPIAEEQNNDKETIINPKPETLVEQHSESNNDESVFESNNAMNFELKLPADSDKPADTSLTFEPMHMVDYFASQGIKISEQEPTDKLGKQLKSFTEWLKTMKKLPGQANPQVGGATESSIGATDLTVQALAEKSNQEDEVLTEPMAEVLARQGKHARAVEVYQKLSLMNPSKSAYFAAKIEQLKDT